MSFFSIKDGDVINNTLKINPKVRVWFYNGITYYNKEIPETGQFHSVATNVRHIDPGEVSLFEYNVDRDETSDSNMIRPFVVKNSDSQYLDGTDWNAYEYGDVMWGSYPVKGKIETYSWVDSADGQYMLPALATANVPQYGYGYYRDKIWALRNTINHYRPHSSYFDYDNFDTEYVRIITIPNIICGSEIKKGSVELNFYYSGELIAKLTDSKENGELVQSDCAITTNNGETAGVVLYKEGIILLFGTWSLSGSTDDYERQVGKTTTADNPRWVHFAAQDDPDTPAGTSANLSSFGLEFKGTHRVNTKTMFLTVEKGQLNYSNNPTFLTYGGERAYTLEKTKFVEGKTDNLKIKNIVKSPYDKDEAEFAPQVWISKIGIYDKDKKLVGIVNLAKPVKCNSDRQYMFKIKLDI